MLTILLSAFVAALACYGYIGLFTRYMADDYCLSAGVHTLGFIKAQTHLYTTWTGRYSYGLLMSAAEVVGPKTVPIGPLLLLMCWLTVTVFATYQIAVLASWQNPVLTSCYLAAVFVFAMLNAADNIFQTFYWQGGLVNYVVPLVLTTLNAGIVFYVLRKRPRTRLQLVLLVITAFLIFFAGGLTEAFGVMQAVGLLMASVAAYKYLSPSARRAVLPMLVIGTLVSLIALAVVVRAPGNAFRQSYFPPPPNLSTLLKKSLVFATGFSAYQVINSPLNALMLFLAPILIACFFSEPDTSHKTGPGAWRILLVIPLAGYSLIFVCFLTGVYATSGALPDRARFIPEFAFTLTALCWSYFVGSGVRRIVSPRLELASSRKLIPIQAMLAVVIATAPVFAVWRTLKLVPGAKASAAIWDQMDVNLRAAKSAGVRTVTVVSPDELETNLGAPRNELHIERNPRDWKNRCVANYYGLDSVTAQ